MRLGSHGLVADLLWQGWHAGKREPGVLDSGAMAFWMASSLGLVGNDGENALLVRCALRSKAAQTERVFVIPLPIAKQSGQQ